MSGKSESSRAGEEMSKSLLVRKLRIALGLEREEGGEMTNCLFMKESEEWESSKNKSVFNQTSEGQGEMSNSLSISRRKFKEEKEEEEEEEEEGDLFKRESDGVREMMSIRRKFNKKVSHSIFNKCKFKKESEGRSWMAKAGLSLVVSMDDRSSRRSGPRLYIRTDKLIRMKGECRECLRPISETCHSKWYGIPLEIEPHPVVVVDGGSRTLSSVFGEMPSPIDRDAVAVALLPRIYVLGGGCYHRRSTQVFSYDITTPHKGWERRPNMRCPRLRPSAVALDGKIYVFGGLRPTGGYNPILPYAEVYDPECDTWEVMSASASMDQTVLHGHALFIDEHHNKNLLVRNRFDSFVTYNISADSFVQQEHIPSSYRGAAEGAVIDDILYLYIGYGLIAYDLTKARWFHEPVRGLSKGTELPDSYDESPFLIHIGNGRLCIIYATSTFEGDVRNLFITCSVLRVSRITSDSGEATLLASLVCHKCYKVPNNDSVLLDCLVL